MDLHGKAAPLLQTTLRFHSCSSCTATCCAGNVGLAQSGCMQTGGLVSIHIH